MKHLGLALLVALLGFAPAQAQNAGWPPPAGAQASLGVYNLTPPTLATGNVGFLQLDAAGNLRTVAAAAPTGTQDINIKQVQGAVPSATNPIWVAPASASTPWAVLLPTTPLIASGNGVVATPSAEATAATSTAATTVLASNLIVKASAGNLYSFNVSVDTTLSAAPWWLIFFNSTTLPANGTITPAKCYAFPAGTTMYSAAFSIPVPFTTGITIGVSTTGCFTQTASVHAFISGDYK